MGTIGDDAIRKSAAASALHGTYAETIDRESAYERMAKKAAPPAGKPAPARKDEDEPGFVEKVMGNSAVKSFLRSAASTVGREITRGLFGTRRR